MQSDWFLPVFISHDKDTASSAADWSIQTQGFIFMQLRILNHFWSKCLLMFESVKNDNTGIVVKLAWFVRPNMNTGWPLLLAWNDSGYALVIPLKYWSRPCLYRDVQTKLALKQYLHSLSKYQFMKLQFNSNFLFISYTIIIEINQFHLSINEEI